MLNSKCARWCITAILVFIIGFATGVMVSGGINPKEKETALIDSLEKVIKDKNEEISDLKEELDYDDDWDDDDDDDEIWYD